MEPNVQEPASGVSPVHDFNPPSGPLSNFSLNQRVYIVLGAALVLGLLSGFLLSQNKGSSSSLTKTGSATSVQKGAVFGSDDTKTFKDQAEGIMKKGGTDGEGAYHLVRPGGDSQNVYLTSSLVDLSKFIDRKVKVWGATRGARVAGWLMDVGRVEVLE